MADAQLSLKDTVKQSLLSSDEGFRQLVSEHSALDARIRQLDALGYLTEPQRYEELSLKKQKLALKDRIEAFVRGGPSHAPSFPFQH